MKIYLVQGTTGEYSDSHDWIVCAYRSSEDAENHARNAMLRAMEIYKDKSWNSYDKREKMPKNEFDPHMSMDSFTGTSYTTCETELKD